ncbi:SDR family NAD(P)-dependent oxidoreductase [Litoreibacter roseus]|uniref:SDR family oxidoreductase n=1 Tax=Litoreibacter roseus TaxID=2601869 RepID=A0A6N6JFD4_9RHOB|nr:SDR family NAD(P)-dependent oxidoreductase [Litoreibacter roseus]GFE65061.1 SDR family oxidoreductase [Litoreibacter roseus]
MTQTLIIGASGGIGSALAEASRARGDKVTTLSRSADGLDVTDEHSIKAALTSLDGPFDLILVATGALEIDGHKPEKTIKSLAPDALLGQFKTNAMGPALVLKHALPLMPKDKRCVFAALSARVGSIGDNQIGGWYSYRTAKAALNQLIHGAAVEIRRSHKQSICVCLHPGTVETPFTEKYAERHKTVPAATAAENLLQVTENLTSDQTGGFFDYAGKEIVW